MYKSINTILFILGISVLSHGNAQPMFYSESLQNLYYSLPETCMIDSCCVADTVILCHDVVPGSSVPIIYNFDENKVLEHIGFHFLPDSKSITNRVIARFIEREMLSMLLVSDIEKFMVSHRENGLSILLNDTPIRKSVLLDKRGIINLLNHYQGITIQLIDGKRYEVTLLFDEEQKLLFLFPAESELITGMDKKERDIRLAVQLTNHKLKPDSISVPDYSYLQLLRDTIYVEKGRSFLTPQINSDLFYIKADSTYSLALDKSLITESFSNALLVPLENSYQIHITHRMYGKIVKKYMVNSQTFDNYFRSDYDRYFGVESLNIDKLTGTLILDNRPEGTIHLAFVSISLDDLLNGGTMEMQLYSNIPQHNIQTLFGKL